MNKIDLHGLTVEEATSELINAIFSWELDEFSSSLTIVTGKGTRSLETAVLDILDNDYDFEYSCDSNGVITLYKN